MPSLLQLLFSFLTWLCASRSVGTPRLRHVWWSLLALSLVLHTRLAPFPRLPLTTAFMSLSFVCTLSFRGASLCPRLYDSSVDWVCSSFRAASVCAASNSVELRSGFVHLRAKRLLVLDHQNLSLHDLWNLSPPRA